MRYEPLVQVLLFLITSGLLVAGFPRISFWTLIGAVALGACQWLTRALVARPETYLLLLPMTLLLVIVLALLLVNPVYGALIVCCLVVSTWAAWQREADDGELGRQETAYLQSLEGVVSEKLQELDRLADGHLQQAEHMTRR